MGGESILENNLILNKKYILEAYILTLLVLILFVTISFRHQITQVFFTNTLYHQWEDARKAWRLNINGSRDLIQMDMVCLAPKNNYDNTIANMNPKWTGDKVRTEEIYEASIRLVNMVWAFQRIIDIQLYNPDDKVAFKAKLYKNINPKSANVIIEETHLPNRDMHRIITLVYCLPIHF